MLKYKLFLEDTWSIFKYNYFKMGQKGLCNNKYYKIILHFLFPDTFYIAFKYAYVRNNFQYGDLQHIQRKFS